MFVSVSQFLLIFPAFIDQTRVLHQVFLLTVCTTKVKISRIFFESDEYLCPSTCTLLCVKVDWNWCILVCAVSEFCIILFVSSRLNIVKIPLLFCHLRILYIQQNEEPRAMNTKLTLDDSLVSICFILKSQKLHNLHIHNVISLWKQPATFHESHHWFPREMPSEKRVSAEIPYWWRLLQMTTCFFLGKASISQRSREFVSVTE